MAPSFLRTLAVALSASSLSVAISPSFNYGSDKVRGVNLGGWLVLEPWITPSLFEATGNDNIIDEWTFGQLQDRSTAKAALQNHWDTWITEQDFADIAAAGLNHVRLPIGYWAFEVGSGEPYIDGQLPYLQKAVDWGRAHNLKVIVDLHGAPGSQNGFDNSGQRLDFPGWHSNQNNIDRTNSILKTIATMFVDESDVVSTIAPLNEPAGFDGQAVLDAVAQYWKDSYGNIRYAFGSAQQSDTVVLLHDAFQPLTYWSEGDHDFTDQSKYQGVAMDTHIYQIFSDDEVSRTDDEHIQVACNYSSSLTSFGLWTIVGEWTPAQTDCAKYLNGRGIGARYDGSYPGSSRIGDCSQFTGSGADFDQSYKTFLRKYWEAQVITYEKAAGWIQWTWKAENADEWTYQAGLKYGWIPKNPSARQYSGICG